MTQTRTETLGTAEGVESATESLTEVFLVFSDNRAALTSIRNRLASLLKDVDAWIAEADTPTEYVPVKAPAEPDTFEEWWAAYPRKEAKGGARAAYRAALKKASSVYLLNGLKSYTFQKERKYIPLATTWLNQERWLDDQSTSTGKAKPNYDDAIMDLFNG